MGWGCGAGEGFSHHSCGIVQAAAAPASLSCSGQQRAAVADEAGGYRVWCVWDTCLVPTPALHTGPSATGPVPALFPWKNPDCTPPRCLHGNSNIPGHSFDDQGLLCAAPAETSVPFCLSAKVQFISEKSEGPCYLRQPLPAAATAVLYFATRMQESFSLEALTGNQVPFLEYTF